MSQVETKYYADSSVTNAKLAVVPPLTLKGNNALIAPGNPQDLTVAQVNVMLGACHSQLTWAGTGGFLNQAGSTTENGITVYTFSAGNIISTVLQVTMQYVPGNPIKLYNKVYASGTSGTIHFQTTSILIRSNIDPITSTTNKRTSTNAAFTCSSSTVNIPMGIVYDITDAVGAINGVSVNPGDQIIITLTRGTDTYTSTAPRCMVLSSIPSFS